MAADGDLLRYLFSSYMRRDDTAFLKAAQEIVGVERAKNHRLLADDLERILLSGTSKFEGGRAVANVDIPKDRERGFPLLDIASYDYGWERLVASSDTMNVLQEVALEHHRRELLAAAGLKPKERILFYGPPGCGKNVAAQVLSSVLSYPLITVRFDAVISSFLGETAANLRRVFDFIQRGRWVVLFDEFDAIGKDRDNIFEHGELKRVVNSLLQMMDAFHGESLLIAATNHEGLLDSAIWRRFEAVVHFTPPSRQDRVLLFRLFLQGFDCSKLDFNRIASKTDGATGADIEALAIESARRATLDGRMQITDDDITRALTLLYSRKRVVATNVKKVRSTSKTASYNPKQQSKV
jgi:SpoVK/Ycf46/Vps4 family AAA+-type ATPase